MRTGTLLLLNTTLLISLVACGGGGSSGGGDNGDEGDSERSSSFSQSIILKNGGQSFTPKAGSPPFTTQTASDPEVRGNPKSIIEKAANSVNGKTARNTDSVIRISATINAASPLSKLYLQIKEENNLFFEITPTSSPSGSAVSNAPENQGNNPLRADFDEELAITIPQDFPRKLLNQQFCAEISAQDINNRVSEPVETCLEVSETKPPNVAPIADAGPNRKVKVGQTVKLDGSKSTDPDGQPITYQWELIELPQGSRAKLKNVHTPIASFTPDIAGIYRAQLTVNDTQVDSHADKVKITVFPDNNSPVANAGADKNVQPQVSVSLDGSNSSDPDGDDLTFQWTLFSKPQDSTAEQDGVDRVIPTLTPDQEGQYVLVLVVNDGKIDSEPDTVIVTAKKTNSAPIADAGPDDPIPAKTDSELVLDGSGSRDADPEDTLTYRWLLKSVPEDSQAVLNNDTTVDPVFTPDKEGEYTVELIVSDGKLDSKPDTALYIATQGNTPPIANAGEDQQTVRGKTVTLDGSDSTDPEGSVLTHQWSFRSRPNGSTATLSDPTSVQPTFTADQIGDYLIEILVSDGGLTSDPDTVVIQVAENPKPIANAGEDQNNVVVNTQVNLDGSQSEDIGGETFSYTWKFQSKPLTSQALLVNESTPNPSFTADVSGQYVIELSVTDEIGQASDPDTVIITTQNQIPTISEIADQTVVAGQTLGPLTFSVSDAETSVDALKVEASAENKELVPDENIQIDGTGAERNLSLTPMDQFSGVTIITLTVTDEGGATSSTKFQLTVTEPILQFLSTPITAATVGEVYTYNINAQDIDPNASITLAATTKPAWLSFQDNGNGTATLSGTPTDADTGDHPVVIEASDNGSPPHSATQPFTITVAAANQPPRFTSTPIAAATVG
jgi:hypothetical protein